MSDENTDAVPGVSGAASSSQGGGGEALRECEGIEIDWKGDKLVITADSGDTFEVTVTITGDKCRKIDRCVWNGRVWVCDKN